MGRKRQGIAGSLVADALHAAYLDYRRLPWVSGHNDLLDMLVIGGVLGPIVLGLMFPGIVVQIHSTGPRRRNS